MKKALLTTALIAALGTAASAQGIAPVATAPTSDVTVGTAGPAIGLPAGAIAAGIIIVGVGIALNSSDGTN